MMCTLAMSSASSTPLRQRAFRSEREPVLTIVSLLLQPGQSSKMTRYPAFTSGSILRWKLAQPLAPGPEPCSMTTTSLPEPTSL